MRPKSHRPTATTIKSGNNRACLLQRPPTPQATKTAGTKAGLNVLRVINEPTAAALAYGLRGKKESKIAVFDLGGGTFDISVLKVNDGVFDVQSTNGDGMLGGEDVDWAVMADLYEKARNLNEKENKKIANNEKVSNNINSHDLEKSILLLKTNKNLKKTNLFKSLSIEEIIQLKKNAEEAKKQLSEKDTINVKVPINKKLININYTVKELEDVARPIIEKTVEPVKKALKDAKLQPSQIDHIILIGGATRMPLVQRLVHNLFNKKPNTEIDPDLAVAKGAAVQAGILSGKVSDILLLDVAPLSLGIETQGGFFSKIINRNTTIPCKQTSTFTTSENNQSEVLINIYQGERPLVKHNKHLARLRLSVQQAEKGKPRIDVEFEIDQNGLLNVSATDKLTGKKENIKLEQTELKDTEIEKMVEEAKENKNRDLKVVECESVRVDALKVLEQKRFASKEECKMLRELIKDEIFDVVKAKDLINEITM